MRGLGDAARDLGTPVVSGNVSFYNETKGVSIHPTPTIGMLGLLEPWERHAVSHFPEAGLDLLLLGETREELGGSEWLALRRSLEAGAPPGVDLEHELRLQRLLAEQVGAGTVLSAHDVSSGGLAVALAECTFAGGEHVGARVELEEGMRPDALLFGESTGRVVVSTRDPAGLEAAARSARVPARRIGRSGGERLVIGSGGTGVWIDATVAELFARWSRAIPRRLEAV